MNNETVQELKSKYEDVLLNKVKVNHATGCWERGNIANPHLYSYLNVWVDNKHSWMGAHRLSYLIYKGDIPDGYLVCHKCDNRHCVNPDHLFIGTVRDNNLDMFKKGRANTCKGSRNWKAKLNEDQVKEILKMWYGGGVTKKDIANNYDVRQSMICKIINKRSWKHISHGEYETCPMCGKTGEK